MLYEAATGTRTFEGKSKASLIAAILDHEPPPISVARPLSPPSLDRVIRACLRKDPEERIQTAHDLMLDLMWIRDGSSSGEGIAMSGGRLIQLSTKGGMSPRNHDGSELFYMAPDRTLMSVVVRPSAANLDPAVPKPLLVLPPTEGSFPFSMTADDHFLMTVVNDAERIRGTSRFSPAGVRRCNRYPPRRRLST